MHHLPTFENIPINTEHGNNYQLVLLKRFSNVPTISDTALVHIFNLYLHTSVQTTTVLAPLLYRVWVPELQKPSSPRLKPRTLLHNFYLSKASFWFQGHIWGKSDVRVLRLQVTTDTHSLNFI